MKTAQGGDRRSAGSHGCQGCHRGEEDEGKTYQKRPPPFDSAFSGGAPTIKTPTVVATSCSPFPTHNGVNPLSLPMCSLSLSLSRFVPVTQVLPRWVSFCLGLFKTSGGWRRRKGTTPHQFPYV